MNKYKFERNVCRKRKPFHVFERDRQGYYTVEVYDPLGSVISYLRNQEWDVTHTPTMDGERHIALMSAIELCVFTYNASSTSEVTI